MGFLFSPECLIGNKHEYIDINLLSQNFYMLTQLFNKLWIYVCARSVQKVSSHEIMKYKDIYWRKYKKTLYIGQRHLSLLQNRHLRPHTVLSVSLPLFKTLQFFCWNLHQLPRHISLNISDGLKSLPFQRKF